MKVLAVNGESLSLAVDENGRIAVVAAAYCAVSVDDVGAAILTEVQHRFCAVTLNKRTFRHGQCEVLLDFQLVPWCDRIIDCDCAVSLDSGDSVGKFRLVCCHLVCERRFSGLNIGVSIRCHIKLSGIVRILSAIDGYIGILYVRVATFMVEIEGLARHISLAICDFADPVTACDADFSIVDCDLTAAAEDSDTVLNVEFGSIDGDNVFPRGVKAAGYIVCFFGVTVEYWDVTLAVGTDGYRVALVPGFLSACVLRAAVAGYYRVVCRGE